MANTSTYSPRIWRSAKSDFYKDEPLCAGEVYTPQELAGIASHGFDAIWLRGRLYDLMQSTVFPELNQPQHEQRIQSMQHLIQRGQDTGMGVYLFFNEPLALKVDNPFWQSHQDLKGQPFHHPVKHTDDISLCTSTSLVQEFLNESIRTVFEQLPGLAGVILITASEYHSHCWSHYAKYGLDDGYVNAATEPLACPRCREREPGEVVLELLNIWQQAARELAPQCRVVAWNWSWSMWYPEPQAQIVTRLPKGTAMMAGWERGGARVWRDRDLKIDEYSLSYVGPGDRFLEAQRLAKQSAVPMIAKLQIGTTHEMATVANLPLIHNLHGKLQGLHRHQVSGFMGTWNFGCSLTLNSFAVGLFCRDSKKYDDREVFLRELACQYFGAVDHAAILNAWHSFCEAFEHYPFSNRLLYVSPINYAPAYPLCLDYRDEPMGPSWLKHEWGDRIDDCLGPFTLDEIVDAFETMARIWQRGLTGYVEALQSVEQADHELRRHCFEECSTAKMIGMQLRSAANIFAFHRWRKNAIARLELQPPCTVGADESALDILRDELANIHQVLAIVQADPRQGYHQEGHLFMYDPQSIGRKIKMIQEQLDQT